MPKIKNHHDLPLCETCEKEPGHFALRYAAGGTENICIKCLPQAIEVEPYPHVSTEGVIKHDRTGDQASIG
jgi:hypothetical protein